MLLIVSDKNRREYQQLSRFARLISRERLGPKKERNAGQRTLLLLQLIVVILFGVHLKVNATASNLPASVGSGSMESVYFFLSDDTTRHLRVVTLYVYLSTYRPSVIDRFPRKATLF